METTAPPAIPTVSVLVEVVGAMGLESKERRHVDPYVQIKMPSNSENSNSTAYSLQKIHQTAKIRHDGNPIWTAKTKSLCIVSVPAGKDLVADDKNNRNKTGEKGAEKRDDDKENTAAQMLIFDVCDNQNRTVLGRVKVPFPTIIEQCAKNGNNNKKDRRLEFCIISSKGTKLSKTACLALRFRKAQDEDVTFLDRLYRQMTLVKQVNTAETDAEQLLHHQSDAGDSSGGGDNVRRMIVAAPDDESVPLQDPVPGDRRVAGDINFQDVKGKSFFKFYHKTDADGRRMQRVLPYPSPDHPDETEWMTSTEIKHTAYAPSTQWITAGSGTVGKLHLEILGCDHLPAMDVSSIPVITDSKADAFCVAAFEDNLVRTDAIWSKESPRWMPWTTRAFQFRVRHPASTLCLAVFDYDAGPFINHDPIGRVVLQLTEFHANVTYTLHYPLQHDPRHEPVDSTKTLEGDSSLERGLTSSTSPPENSRGTVIVRLRMEWEDHAMRLFYTPQPPFIINVDNKKAYHVLRYATRGAIDEENASIKTIKMYANEIMSYTQNICYSLDVILETLLWRGTWQITQKRQIWFPIHSVAIFTSAALVIEHPKLAVPICLYMIAWVFLSINYHATNHPYPWKRIHSSLITDIKTIMARRTLFSSVFRAEDSKKEYVEIAPGEGVREAAIIDMLDRWKARRMLFLIGALVDFATKLQTIYSKTSDQSVQMTTKIKKWSLVGSLLEGKLYPIHSALQSACNGIRFSRNFVNWKSNRTSLFTTACITVATAWVALPMNTILKWSLRILVWSILGPWMTLVDRMYFRSWYATKEENLDRIREGRMAMSDEPTLPDVDAILESETFWKVTKAGRIKAEELHKLRDMRRLTFGSYSDSLPSSDNSRYPSIPLPESTAVCSEWIVPPSNNSGLRGYHVPGQFMTGDMVHNQPGLALPADTTDGSQPDKNTDVKVEVQAPHVGESGIEVTAKNVTDKKRD